MFQLPALTVPMGSTALQAAAEALTRQSGALSRTSPAPWPPTRPLRASVAIVDSSAKLVSGPDETVPQRLPPSVDAPLPLDQPRGELVEAPLDKVPQPVEVVSRMWWKLPSSGLRACNDGSSQAARSRDIGSRGWDRVSQPSTFRIWI